MPSLSCLLAFVLASAPGLARRIDSVASISVDPGFLRIERDSVCLHWGGGLSLLAFRFKAGYRSP